MPAPRTCRECAAVLPGDVRRCLACGAPVRDFALRAFVSAPNAIPASEHVHSRWQGGPTTFGPVGRIIVTALIVLVGVGVTGALFAVAWPFALWFLLGWGLASGMVLRHTWQEERVIPGTIPPASPVSRPQARVSARSAVLGRKVPAAVPVAGLLLASAAVAVYVWSGAGGFERFFIVAGLLTIGLGFLLARFNGL
jgi:hypothetical protein